MSEPVADVTGPAPSAPRGAHTPGPAPTTPHPPVGSPCWVNTTGHAGVGAGAVKESRRSVWALGQVKLNDGGSDGVASTTPNSVFAVQGVVVP